MSDPVCGNCGNPLSAHYRERCGAETRVYCNTTTNGDVFTDEPQDSAILQMLVDRMPDIYDALVRDWKRENGHAIATGWFDKNDDSAPTAAGVEGGL